MRIAEGRLEGTVDLNAALRAGAAEPDVQLIPRKSVATGKPEKSRQELFEAHDAMDRKRRSLWRSKTIWLGLATIATAVMSAVVGGAGWQEAVIAAIGAVNIFIRTQTDKPIAK